MTVNKVWEKLRKKNQEHYRQFQYSVGFAVMLISSYLNILFSPLVQRTLPEGGDSRMQVSMIFFVAAIGCLIFVIYASGMFLRYKSKEVGVFLALGMEKRKVRKVLAGEITKILMKTAVLGIAAGSFLSFIIGKTFEVIARKASIYHFAITAEGLTYGITYALIIVGIIIIMVFVFMKRTNIIDVLNEQRKQEPLKKMVTSIDLMIGIALTGIGILVGFVLPKVVTEITHHYLGGWTNLFYAFSLAGLYRIMVYTVSCHKKGKNPQKYYNNMVLYGMLKFYGRTIVRNMLVITLLIIGGLFAVFYIPINISSMQEAIKNYEDMYSYFYTEDAKELTEKDVEVLAKQYGVNIQNYREGEFLQVLGSGVNRDNLDDNNNLKEVYEKKYCIYECISASQFSYLTGQKIDIDDGKYYMIQSPNVHENIFNHFNDMDQLYMDRKHKFFPIKYAGNLIYQCLVSGDGFDVNARYVVSDKDYEKIKTGTSQYHTVRQVLFNSTKGSLATSFANKLYQEFANKISDSMKVGFYYDAYKAETAEVDSMYRKEATYDPDNPVKESDWQYEPNFLILKEENTMLTYSVFLLLFLYVAVICLAAVGIVSYTRSQSVGLNSKQVLYDLKKLGANHFYLKNMLRKQIRKVYVLPTVLGSFVILVFEILMLKMNDGVLTKGEVHLIPVLMFVEVIVVIYQYFTYCCSFRKVTKTLGLQK